MPTQPKPARRRARGRVQLLLLVLGVGFAATLAAQLWRTAQLERTARALELDRATAVAERILRQAASSAAALARVAPTQRFVVRQGGVEVDPAVGWLWPADGGVERDLVVDDRLARAARAEFALGDRAAAQREFDELLAGPLPSIQRPAVLAAAAWQSRRTGDAERLAALRDELDACIAGIAPGDLGRPSLARAVAAAARLPRPAAPAWADALLPLLPPGSLAGLDAPGWLAAQQHAVLRRGLLQRADQELRARPPTAVAGLRAVGQELLWWQARADGGHDAALLPAEGFLAAARAAGDAGDLPAWPWLVEAEFGDDPTAAVADVPFLRALHAAPASAMGTRPWLLPALTLALLTALAAAAAQMLRATNREAAAVAAQADFLTNVTHELRTPLASIRLLGEMLAEGRARGRETEYHTMLVGEATRLSMLIENVLDLGRAERGERALDLRPTDVEAVVRETVAVLQPQPSPGGSPIVVAPASGPPPVARCDRGALVQALVALLDNARKYGGGPIEIALITGADVRIDLRDHGPGVPAAERERIFERFVRGNRERHGATPGVGIGLYLARTIVRRQGGDLVCTSPRDGGAGALFSLTLPRETSA